MDLWTEGLIRMYVDLIEMTSKLPQDDVLWIIARELNQTELFRFDFSHFILKSFLHLPCIPPYHCRLCWGMDSMLIIFYLHKKHYVR